MMARGLLPVLILACISILFSAEVSSGLEVTKEVSGIDPDDVIVECYEDGVKIIIEKSRFARLHSPDNLHFADPLCRAGENETHFIASTSFRRCGITRKVQWNGLIYSSSLMTGYPESDDFDSRCPVVSIKFTCLQSFFVWPRPRMTRAVSKYINCEHIVAIGPKIKQGIFAYLRANSTGLRMRQRVLSCPMLIGIGPPIERGEFARVKVKSKGILVKRTQAFVCRSIEGKGEHQLSLKAYSDEGFSKEIGKVLESPFLSIDVFYELKLSTSVASLTIYPKRCYATPTKDPFHKIKYTFIKDGCIKDSTMQLYTSGNQLFRFSIQSFKFANARKTVMFIHCDVAICDVEDRESFCAKGCNQNNIRRRRGGRRRSAIVEECKFDRIHVSLRRSFFKRAVRANLQLDDPNCIASVNETHFSFNIHHGTCGTLAKTTGSLVEISNYINYRTEGRQVFSVPVKCTYTKEKGLGSAVRAFQISHQEKYVSIWLGRKYHFNKKIVLDSSVSKFIEEIPLDIRASEDGGVLDVTISTVDDEMDFVIDHCKIKPSPSSQRERLLIINGCSSDKSVIFDKSNRTARFFIDFKRWNTQDRRLFTKCHFTVCHRNTPSSKCARKGCQRQIIHNSRRQKRSTNLNNVNAEVSCSANKILVAIDKKTAPRVKSRDLHLRDKKCRASENSTHIILETIPSECQTKVKAVGRAVEYENVVLNGEQIYDGIISREDTFRLPFRCIFVPTESPKSSAGFKAKKALVKFSGISYGTFAVRLTLFTDPTFETEMNSLSARLSPGSEMYFEVSMEAPNVSMAMYLEFCYGKPFFSSDKDERFIFIKNNCPVDDTVLFYRTDRVDQKRFSVSPFEFSGAVYKSVFVTCVVSACDPNDTTSRCFQTCPDTPLPL